MLGYAGSYGLILGWVWYWRGLGFVSTKMDWMVRFLSVTVWLCDLWIGMEDHLFFPILLDCLGYFFGSDLALRSQADCWVPLILGSICLFFLFDIRGIVFLPCFFVRHQLDGAGLVRLHPCTPYVSASFLTLAEMDARMDEMDAMGSIS